MDTIDAFGAAVRERRDELKLSQGALANAAGMHHSQISRIERGLTNPRFETILKVAHGLDLLPGELVKRAGRLEDPNAPRRRHRRLL
jgi:transcriptional regulator with XRE-family HTH domain